MQEFIEIGRILILIGVLSIFLGVLITFSGQIPFIGKLPGDLYIRKGPVHFYLPLTSSILISLLLSWLLNQLK